MNTKHTLLVEFSGDQPAYSKGIRVLGGEVVAVAFNDALAEIDRLTEQRDGLLAALERCKFDSLNMSIADLQFCRSAYLKATGEQA